MFKDYISNNMEQQIISAIYLYHMLTGPLKPKECADIAVDLDGVYTIYPERDDRPVLVYCIMSSLPKWTVSR